MRYAELFAGAGGLSLGLDRAGMECAWHAEIADFPRRVLKHRWPDVPLYGDVTELDGAELVRLHGPIDLLSGGSPCQDLSVAGKRAGMTEGSGTRSSLFYEQLRIWNETGAEFLLWENVDGARSSNNGKDFGAVLSAIVGAPVFVPSDGWSSGGVAAGPSGIAAWRVLDAQFFGVPQRRRRIFVLCSRTGRVDPAEILSLPEGLRGDPETSGETGERPSASLGERTESESGVKLFAIAHGEARERDIASCIPANAGPNRHGEGSHSATQFDAILTDCTSATGSVTHSLRADGFDASEDGTGRGTPVVIVGVDTYNADVTGSIGHTLPSKAGAGRMPHVLSFAENQRGELRLSEVDTSLNSGGGKPGEGYPAVLAFENHGQDSRFNQLKSAFPAINNLPLILESAAPALDRSKTPAVVAWDDELNPSENIIGSLKAREHSGQSAQGIIAPTFSPGAHPGGFNGQDTAMVEAITRVHGIPRRLMPIECERLMSWPDNWTNVPDSNGKPASDAARYKACGNGVASHCVQWIAERLVRGVA